jgi:hypothetical protein
LSELRFAPLCQNCADSAKSRGASKIQCSRLGHYFNFFAPTSNKTSETLQTSTRKMKRAACPEEDHFPKRHRQDSPATRFPASPMLDAPTLTSLQAAVIPGATAPAANLAVIGTMLNVTVAEAKRQVDATAQPSRDSVMLSWCLDYELNGEDRFVEEYYCAPEWIHKIDLDNVSIAYLESTVSPGWHTSKQDYYPRRRAMRVLKTVWFAQSDEYEGVDPAVWPALRETYWPDGGPEPSWGTIALVREALAAELKRLKMTHDDGSDSDA